MVVKCINMITTKCLSLGMYYTLIVGALMDLINIFNMGSFIKQYFIVLINIYFETYHQCNM